MKRRKNKCPLVPTGSKESCPLQPAPSPQRPAAAPPSVVVIRTERRSWITLAITGLGALLVRYLRTIRERGHTVKPARNSR